MDDVTRADRVLTDIGRDHEPRVVADAGTDTLHRRTVGQHDADVRSERCAAFDVRRRNCRDVTGPVTPLPVAAIEATQHSPEHDLAVRRRGIRKGERRGAGHREFVAGRGDVDPDTHGRRRALSFEQDTCDLEAVDEHVVRPLQLWLEPGYLLDALSDGETGEQRQPGPARVRDGARAQQDGERQTGPRW